MMRFSLAALLLASSAWGAPLRFEIVPNAPCDIDISKPELLVIRTQAQWEAIWCGGRRCAKRRGNSPRPVDFSLFEVYVVSLGRQTGAGVRVEIVSVVESASGVRVTYRTTPNRTYPPGVPVPAVVNCPAQAVKVKRTGKPVVLQEEGPAPQDASGYN